MARPRKKHRQLELSIRGRRRTRRRGVRLGRPPKGPRSSERHGVRPELDPRHPVHVTCRIARDLASLRTRHMYRAVRAATRIAARRTEFRIVHLSIQRDHVIGGLRQIHHAVYHQRRGFKFLEGSGLECPLQLEILDVAGSNLRQRAVSLG